MCADAVGVGLPITSVYTYTVRVAESLRTLEKQLERFVDVLAHRPVWIQVDGAATDRDAIRAACEAFGTIRYAMEEDVETSPVCLGVIAASAEVIACAEQLNAAKADFKALCAPLQRVRMRVPVRGDDGPTKALSVLRVILRALQRSDLNVHAAYRKVPILAAPPRLIAYTRARTRSVYRKSVEEISTTLMNYEGADAARDRARLASLTPRETHLALVREHYENVRANVAYRRLDKRGRGRVQVPAELPLLCPTGKDFEAPEVRYPASGDSGNEVSRARESKLEREPFLRSLPVYRYAR